MPVAQRPRCCRNDGKVSGCRPATMAWLTYMLRQPLAWISMAVSASSVIVLPEIPPTKSSASRRRSAAEPQKNAPPHRSSPLVHQAVEHLVFRRRAFGSCRLRAIGSGLRKKCGVWTRASLSSSAEIADRPRQEVARRHMVGVEDRNELAVKTGSAHRSGCRPWPRDYRPGCDRSRRVRCTVRQAPRVVRGRAARSSGRGPCSAHRCRRRRRARH